MLRRYLLFISFLSLATISFAQVAQVEFGKNRVQYHDFFEEWSQYESENFVTYWYGLSRNVGQSVVQLAEYDFAEIQNLLEHRINEKVQIVVYADLSDVKQSNIGTEEVFINTGGQTKIVANTIFVYFDGNHNNLRKQIREGVTQVYLNAMLFGANIQEIVQNAVMLNLPNWFKDGMISFVGEYWSTELDDELKAIILSEDFENFQNLSEENAKLAGHSFWYFISESYGLSIVTNLLYLTRINRSIESGLLYVLGNSFETVTYEWENFYKARYKNDQTRRTSLSGQPLAIKNKKELPLTELKLSPDGTQLIYILNETGKYKIYLHNLVTEERTLIKKGGFKNLFQLTDLNYPIVAWNPNSQELAVITERRDKLTVETLNLSTKKWTELIIPEQYQRIYSVDYLDPFTLLFSATVSGNADLFSFNTRTQLSTRLTNDYHDDLDAVAATINGEKGILFASNRPDTLLENRRLDTILPINNFDLFFLNQSRDLKELVRITNTPLANERQPMPVDSTYFAYLSDQKGIYNREVGRLEDFIHHYDQKIWLNDGTDIIMHADSSLELLDTALIDSITLLPIVRQRAITHTNTNYPRNILQQHNVAQFSDRFVEMVRNGDQLEVYIRTFEPQVRKSPPPTVYQMARTRTLAKINLEKSDSSGVENTNGFPQETTQIITIGEAPVGPVKDTLDPLEYYFQSEFGNPKKDAADPVRTTGNTALSLINQVSELPSVSVLEFLRSGVESRNMHRFRPANIVPYKLQFRTDYFSTQMDNNLLFEGLDNFAANPDGVFGYPPPGILLKANVKDLLEDHIFEGGVRVPTTFNGAEYFLTYIDRKRRLDKHYAVYMKRQRINEGSIGFVPRRKENIILMGQYGVRYPLNIFQSVRARATLRQDRLTQLISDQASSNVPTQSATRAGLRLEYVFDNTIERDLNILNGSRVKVFAEVFKKFNLSASDGVDLNFSNGAMTILNIDARHYQRILKHSIFATRFAAATTFGSERIQYFLGGTDNWLLPQYNNDIPTTNNNYAFQTAAPNIRGFRFGIRNGNSYALVNSELRVPLFQYFSNNIKSSFLRNFQVVGFFDVGTAWEGNTPYREDNPLNTTIFEEGNIIDVTVNYFRDPIVAGYGVGARAMLFGYFIRADYGWGIETRQVQEPRLYLSLGLDF
jgi:Tol biopolymer transport system component